MTQITIGQLVTATTILGILTVNLTYPLNRLFMFNAHINNNNPSLSYVKEQIKYT